MSDLQDDRELDEVTDDGEELDAEQLKEQLAKKEQDIQFLKGKWGEEKSQLKGEFEQLKQQLAQFDGRISEQREMMSQSKSPAKDPYELDEETLTQFRDDPAKVIDFFKGREQELKRGQSDLVSTMLEALKERDAMYSQEFGSLKRGLDPEIQAWKPSIDELRQNEKFSKLDDETLIEIAKAKDLKPSMEYMGAAGGQRSRGKQEKAQPFNPNSEEGNLLMQMLGNEEAAKRAWTRKENKRIGQ